MEHEIEIEGGEGQTVYITYEIIPHEKRTLEHPGVEGGIEIISAYNSRGGEASLSTEVLEEMVQEELESYAEDAAIDNWEDNQHEDWPMTEQQKETFDEALEMVNDLRFDLNIAASRFNEDKNVETYAAKVKAGVSLDKAVKSFLQWKEINNL